MDTPCKASKVRDRVLPERDHDTSKLYNSVDSHKVFKTKQSGLEILAVTRREDSSSRRT